MAKDYPTVLYDVDGVVARITLNRPEKRNALNDELIAALKEALRRAHDEEDVRVVVVTGKGDDFCSGADLAGLQKVASATIAENLEDARSLMELFVLLRELRRPVIAAVRGGALGGGFGLGVAWRQVLRWGLGGFGLPEVMTG